MARRLLVAATALAALAVVALPTAHAADSADLEVWISQPWDLPDMHEAKAGGAVTFDVGATNHGPNTAVNATISLPVSGFLLAIVTDYRGTTCTRPDADGSGTLVCTAPEVASGAYMEIEVTVATPPTGGISIHPTVSSDTPDPTPANNSASDSSSRSGFASNADLSASGGGPQALTPGSDFTVNVQAYNGWTYKDPAVHVGVLLPVPDGVTLVSAGPADVSESRPHDGCGITTVDGHPTVQCSTPALLEGTGVSFSVVFHLASDATVGSTLHMSVSGVSDTTDPNLENNTSTFDVYVGGADLDVTAAGPATAPAGEDASYTITIGNDGPEAAVNPVLRFSPPWRTDFVSLEQTSGPAFDCTVENVEGSTQVECTRASLAVGATAQFTLVVTLRESLEADDTISLHPNVYSDTPDGDDDDNSATATTTVSVLSTPTIDGFSPVYAAVGTVVTVTGSALSGTTEVVFHTTHATTFTVDSDSQLHATVPKGTTTGLVTVTTAAGSATSTDPLTILTAKPVFTSFTPNHAVVGDTVTITGSKLTGATAVLFAGTPAAVIPIDDKHIGAQVPPGAVAGKLSVVNAVGTTTNGAAFTPVHPPSIASFSPAGGGKRGSVVTLSGSGFLAMNDATLGGVDARFRVVSDTVMTVTVPTTASTGTIAVVNDAGSATSGDPFTVILPPKVTSFTPHHGPANAMYSTDVVITGTGFTGTSTVKIGSKPAASFHVDSDTQITATTALGSASGKVTVKNVAGTSSGKETFVVDQPPVVTSFTPLLGRKTATLVTITGRNFTPDVVVDFNGTTASKTFVSKTKITATVPPGSTTGKVTVTNGYGAGTSAKDFGVIQAPAIAGFTPALGAKTGASVSVVGTGFLGTTSVTFNGVAATFTVKSDTLIVVRVPSRATTGKIRVTNAEGFAESGGDFTVLR